MAHRLGMKVIAKAVETGEQLSDLRPAGCDSAQDYYISRSVSAACLGDPLREQDEAAR